MHTHPLLFTHLKSEPLLNKKIHSSGFNARVLTVINSRLNKCIPKSNSNPHYFRIAMVVFSVIVLHYDSKQRKHMSKQILDPA